VDEKNKKRMIRGTTRLIAHLGYPIEAVKAPMIYNPFFEQRNIDAVVVPWASRPAATSRSSGRCSS
jgi:shikimate dehydrogenase